MSSSGSSGRFNVESVARQTESETQYEFDVSSLIFNPKNVNAFRSLRSKF